MAGGSAVQQDARLILDRAALATEATRASLLRDRVRFWQSTQGFHHGGMLGARQSTVVRAPHVSPACVNNTKSARRAQTKDRVTWTPGRVSRARSRGRRAEWRIAIMSARFNESCRTPMHDCTPSSVGHVSSCKRCTAGNRADHREEIRLVVALPYAVDSAKLSLRAAVVREGMLDMLVSSR